MQWYDCSGKGYTPTGLFGPSGQFENVPIPDDATPTKGTDQELSIYQPSTDTLWDFWKARHTENGWRACWGGRIDHVFTTQGVFPFPFGASASGLPGEAGMVSINDVSTGRIDHAVALLIPEDQVAAAFVWPANRSDGESMADDAIPEGARLRLDPRLDVSSLGLTPIGAMVALAAQRYGFIVTDRSGTLTIPAEGPYAYQAAVGVIRGRNISTACHRQPSSRSFPGTTCRFWTPTGGRMSSQSHGPGRQRMTQQYSNCWAMGWKLGDSCANGVTYTVVQGYLSCEEPTGQCQDRDTRLWTQPAERPAYDAEAISDPNDRVPPLLFGLVETALLVRSRASGVYSADLKAALAKSDAVESLSVWSSTRTHLE